MNLPQFTTEELNSEEWITISGFEMYEVSTLGRIRRAIACRSSAKGRILKPGKASSGYAQVSLVNGRVCTKLVHVLVARAFIGEPPSSRHEVNHKNGDKLDPRLSNLEYLTRKQNTIHAIQVLGHRRDGEHASWAKFTKTDILAIHKALMEGVPPSEIIRQFGISETQLYRIKKRETWKEYLSGLPDNYPAPRS